MNKENVCIYCNNKPEYKHKLGSHCKECKQSYHYECIKNALLTGNLDKIHKEGCKYYIKEFEKSMKIKKDGKKRKSPKKKRKRSLKKKN